MTFCDYQLVPDFLIRKFKFLKAQFNAAKKKPKKTATDSKQYLMFLLDFSSFELHVIHELLSA